MKGRTLVDPQDFPKLWSQLFMRWKNNSDFENVRRQCQSLDPPEANDGIEEVEYTCHYWNNEDNYVITGTVWTGPTMLRRSYCEEELGYRWVGEGAMGLTPAGCDGACECCKPLKSGDCVLKDFLQHNWRRCGEDIYVISGGGNYISLYNRRPFGRIVGC